MIVVHGLVVQGGRLALWAETSAPPRPTGRRGRQPTPHPFAVLPPAELLTATPTTTTPGPPREPGPANAGTGTLPTERPRGAQQPAADRTEQPEQPEQPSAEEALARWAGGEVGTVDLELPTAGTRPLPSPELAAHLTTRRGPRPPAASPSAASPSAAGRPADRRPAGGDPGRVLAWTVPIVYVPPGTDLEALCAGLTDVRAGSSIGHLTDVVAFAADLVARGRVAPDLIAEPARTAAAATTDAGRPTDPARVAGGGWAPEARWRPVVGGAAAGTLDTLVRAMPGVAHAAGAWTAEEAVRAALDAEVDALVRARLAGRPLLAEGQVRQDSVVRAWLTALTTPDARLRPATIPSARPLFTATTPAPHAATNPAATGPANNNPDVNGRGVTGPDAAEHTTGLRVAATGPGGSAHTSATTAVIDGVEVARVRDVLRRWVDSGRAAAVRTCFRLSYVEEFADDETSGWLVEFLLQPADEPGLLVPAEDVWRDAASPLFRWVDYPQDVLLEDLGRAGRLWPELDDALRQARPTGIRLDVEGAHRFLTHAEVLLDAGFGVLLPQRWQRRQELGLTLTVHTRQPASPVLRDTTANRDAIVRYRWGLAIGDEFLSEHDLAELARAKVPLVRLRGRWVHLDRERLRAGLAFLARGGEGEMSAGEAMRLTRLIPEDGDLPLPVAGVDGSGWLADLLTGRAVERLELLDPPAALTATLRPYQRRGFSWLAFLDGIGVGALLADDMGLGKTVQVLALEAYLRQGGPRPPTLIVCPLSVLGNWRREIERFTPGLRVRVHHGSDRLTGPQRAADLVLTTYQVATRDADLLAGTAWDRIVLDEAQHVKNATGVTARAVRRIPARHRVALTGTPVENRLTELWSIADFLNPGILGPASIFRARYSVPVERYADPDAAGRLRRVTRPFLLRRVKTDRAVIADLPEKLERKQWCNLTLEQATLYQAVVDDLVGRLKENRGKAQRKGLVLAAMTKLKQVCNHPAHLMGDGTALAGRSGKLTRLEEILAAALDGGDRALVFTQYAKFGHMLAPHLAERLGTEVAFLHGGTAKGARDAMVQRFQAGGGPGVLLLSLKAGGTGLNLTAANHVVHVDRWWNPATEQQATDRAFRIGQRRDVQVHTFVCVGTIEERVDHIMTEKRTLAGVAVGSGEGWLTGLSTDDLVDLMTLSPEATDD